MKILNIKDSPIKVFGIPFFEEKKVFERIPLEIREQVKSLEFYGRRCPGARVGFKTDAAEFTVRIGFKTFSVDAGMSIFAAHSANVMIGERQKSEYIEHICPPDYETKQFEKVVKKSNKMEEVTIWLPMTVWSNFRARAPGSRAIRASYRARASRRNCLEKGTITARV